MSARETAVIEAAVDYCDWLEGRKYGHVPPEFLERERRRLRKAVADLHCENDGRWQAPPDPSDD